MSEQHEAETSGEWTPAPAERYASVWPHTLGDYEKWPDAVGVILDSGALVVRRAFAPASTVPLKIYAPGAWATVEHVGDYTTPPTPQPPGIQDWARAKRHAAADPAPARAEDLPGAAGSDLPGEPTGELPRYRDPVEQLDPDLLDQENGDVNYHSGVGTLPPRPPAPGFGTADPDEGGGDPKAVAAADTAEDPDDTSLARFVLGGSWDRPRRWLQARPWRRPRGAQASLARRPQPSPTHLLSVAQPRSRIAWWFLAVSLPLLLLVLTTH